MLSIRHTPYTDIVIVKDVLENYRIPVCGPHKLQSRGCRKPVQRNLIGGRFTARRLVITWHWGPYVMIDNSFGVRPISVEPAYSILPKRVDVQTCVMKVRTEDEYRIGS